MFYLSRKGIDLLTGFALQLGISENPFFESQIDTYHREFFFRSGGFETGS